MKPILLILTISFFMHNSIHAQWTIKHLDENSHKTGTIKFKNDSLGLSMGGNFMDGNFTFLKSRDKGDTWNIKHLDINVDIHDFQFIGDSSIFAVGDYYTGNGENRTSKLIKSENLGESWDSISNFAGKQLNSLHFFNNDSGIVAGYDEIYRTVDTGKSWNTVWSIKQFGYKFGELIELSFPSSEIGYAIGIGLNQFDTGSGFDFFLLKTNNSGISWVSINTFPKSLASIYFINQFTGFIGTESGVMYKTNDGGNNWKELQLTHSGNGIKSIQFISEMKGFATGGAMVISTGGGESSNFFISKTLDGGETWASFDTLGIPLNSIYFVNDTLGFVSGAFELIMKSNGEIDKLPEDFPWHLVGDPNSIDENKFSSSRIKIYPNPTDGTLFVQNLNSDKEIKSISLINTSGQTIDIRNSVSNNELIQLNLSDFKSGMYLIKTVYTDKIELMKIIKK